MSRAKASVAKVVFVAVVVLVAAIAFIAPLWAVVPILALVYVVPQIIPTRRMPTPAASADESLQTDPYASEVIARLKADGNTVTTVELPSGPAIVGYQTKFRLRWFATRLHLFTMVIQVRQLSASTLAACVTETIRYSTSRRGAFHFFQGGSAVITAVRSADVSQGAKGSATSRPQKRWLVMSIPLVLDATTDRKYLFAGRAAWGAAYSSWIGERVRNVFP